MYDYLSIMAFLIIFALLRKSFAFMIAIPWDSSPSTTILLNEKEMSTK